MGQNRRSGTVTLHAPDRELKLVWSLLSDSWDLTVVLREESRSPCLLPWHGRREVLLIEKGARSGNFIIHRKKLRKGGKAKELGKIHEAEVSPNQPFNTIFSRATEEASLPSQELLLTSLSS